MYTCMRNKTGIQKSKLNKGSGPPLSSILLSMVSVTCSQLWSENTKWKIPEFNNS